MLSVSVRIDPEFEPLTRPDGDDIPHASSPSPSTHTLHHVRQPISLYLQTARVFVLVYMLHVLNGDFKKKNARVIATLACLNKTLPWHARCQNLTTSLQGYSTAYHHIEMDGHHSAKVHGTSHALMRTAKTQPNLVGRAAYRTSRARLRYDVGSKDLLTLFRFVVIFRAGTDVVCVWFVSVEVLVSCVFRCYIGEKKRKILTIYGSWDGDGARAARVDMA
jgi:hypothetical protein